MYEPLHRAPGTAIKLDTGQRPIFLFASVFLISLQSMYYYSIGLAPFVVLGSILAASYCWVRGVRVESRSTKAFLTVFVLLFLTEIPISWMGSEVPTIARAGALFLLIALVLSVPHFLIGNKVQFVLRGLLTVHVFAFLLQWFCFYALKIDIDPVGALSEQVQSGRGGSLEHDVLGKFVRLGGLFNEPGTYATYIAPLLIIFLSFAKNNKADSATILLTLVSLILTFSIYAYVFSAIISLGIIIRRPSMILPLAMLAPFIVLLSWPYIEYRFFNPYRVSYDSGFGFRAYNAEVIFYYINSTFRTALIGNGFLAPPQVPILGAFSDSGLIITTLFYFGYVRSIFFGYLIYLSASKLRWWGVPFAIVLLASKAQISVPFFWITIIVPLLLQQGFARKATTSAADHVGERI